MERKLICIICPRGCGLTADITESADPPVLHSHRGLYG